MGGDTINFFLNDKKDEISDSDKLDDANKLNEGFKSENGRVNTDVDPVARLNDWIQEVDQKQKDLKTRSTVARKAETGMKLTLISLNFLFYFRKFFPEK